MRDSYDTIVIGGGPAGSTTAALMAQAGWKTLLIERDREPRGGPAESLTRHAAARLVRLGSLASPATVNVARHELVRGLWEVAEQRGAYVLTDARALRVLLVGGQAVGACVELPSGEQVEIPCSLVIDASGQAALLATQLRFKRAQTHARQAIIWGVYRGVVPEPNQAADCSYRAGNGRATFRMLSLADDLACLSLCGNAAYLLNGRGTPEEIFEDELVLCPTLVERLIQARLVDRFLVAIQHSFTVQPAVGNGWRLVGDARQPADLFDPGALSAAILSGCEMAETLAGVAPRPVLPRRLSVPASNTAC